MEKRAYDNSNREKAALLRRTLRDLEEPREQAPLKIPKVQRPRRIRGASERRALLPANLTCPSCGEQILASKSWVVGQAIHRGLEPECKRCWAVRLAAGPLPPYLPPVESPIAKAIREAEGLPAPVAPTEPEREPGESKQRAAQRVRSEHTDISEFRRLMGDDSLDDEPAISDEF